VPEKTLNDLFLAHLKDIYYAEKKIYRTLPKMVKAANDAELKKAFTTHREETQGQIERLEQVFETIGKRPQAKPCEAINGIVAEGEETIEESAKAPRSIQVPLQRAKRSNTMRWRATAHSLRGPVSSACARPQHCSTKRCKRK
jgi:ferritin-like metal-binding protein YciE